MSDEKEIDVNFNESEKNPETPKDDDQKPAESDSSSEEPESAPAETESTDEPVEELTDEEQLRLKVAEVEDRYLRTVAEFDNFRKRTARQYDHLVRSAGERVLSDLLDIVDNFERGLEHSNGEADVKQVREGMELIHNQMVSMLGKHDVAPIEAQGEKFDPNLHEALMEVASDEYPEGVVAVEINRGYMIGDRVLRHTKVGVSKGSETKDDPAEK